MHIGVNNLPKVVTQFCPEQELNPRPVDHQSDALPFAPPRHLNITSLWNKNSSGDEITNVNFLKTISHTRRPTSKYRKRDKPTTLNKLDGR